MWNVIKWGLIFASIVAVGIILWMLGLTGPKKPVEVRVAENEINCVAAAGLADGKREPGVNMALVHERVMKAVRQHSIVNKTPVCTVFEKGLTTVPVGYKRSRLYQGRRVWFVKGEFSKTEWDDAESMAKKVLEMSPSSLGCATHLIRADRTFKETKEAIAGIRAMKPIKKDPSDLSKAEFFCQ